MICDHNAVRMRTQSKNSKLTKARENAGDQVATGFACESDWLWKWLDSSLLITERSKAKLKRSLNTFDTSLKIDLVKKKRAMF